MFHRIFCTVPKKVAWKPRAYRNRDCVNYARQDFPGQEGAAKAALQIGTFRFRRNRKGMRFTTMPQSRPGNDKTSYPRGQYETGAKTLTIQSHCKEPGMYLTVSAEKCSKVQQSAAKCSIVQRSAALCSIVQHCAA
uniref:Uncharacterized protein ORFU1 n=1 Tax=Janthinobacterium sp. (strain J3) TaxID=213804 RepID=Q84IJ9_JANS3|nr:hypothetical protein [Janthinobacterium sp. J3]